jgi:hypothetical protein
MKRSLKRYFLSFACLVVVSCLSWALVRTAAGQNADAKAPGIIRVGVALPVLEMGPMAGGEGASESVREVVMNYLAGPSFEVVPLTAQLPIQAEAEGREEECDFIVYTALSAKQAGGSGARFLKGASRMSNTIPMMGRMRGVSRTIAGTTAVAVLHEAAVAASMVKAKTEVSFEYKLVAEGSSVPVLSDVVKKKATEDGEDVISGLVEKAAGAVINVILNKK